MINILFNHVCVLMLVLICSSSWAIVPLTKKQQILLSINCVQCHASNLSGAPVIGKPNDWKKIIKQGEDGILRNIVYGINGMPPLGYCSACNESDFRAIIRVMTGGFGDVK